MLAAEGEPDAAPRQVAPHAGSRFQSECAAAGQQDGVDAIGHVGRIEGGRFLGSAGRAANVHSAHGALLAENRRAAGERLVIGDVADANAGNISETLHGLYGSIGVRRTT